MLDTDPAAGIRQWTKALADTVKALEHPATLPPAPGLSGDRAADAAAFLQLLDRLGCDPNSPTPGAARNRGFQARAEAAAKFVRNAVEEGLHAIDRHLSVLAAVGTPGLLTGAGPFLVKLATPSGQVYAAVDCDHPDLPADHPVRSLLNRAELYGDPPRYFALGPLYRPWFSAAAAVALTRQLAAEDRSQREEHRRAVQAEQERQNARNRGFWEASPAGKAAAAEREKQAIEKRLRDLESRAAVSSGTGQ
jgi:hypothetical protein